MEATLSKLQSVCVPKHKVTAPKRPYETDGGDSSDDNFSEDDTCEERQAKMLYNDIRKQAINDVRKSNKYAMDKIKSSVHKYSLGKRMCIFTYKSGPLKGERCGRERSGKHGKYCSAEHMRQVNRRGKRSKKNNVNVLPGGPTLYLDNKGAAHTQTVDVDEVEAKFMQVFGKRPQLLAPAPTLALPPAQGDDFEARYALMTGKTFVPLALPAPQPPQPNNIEIEEIDLDDSAYARIATVATSMPVIAQPTFNYNKPVDNDVVMEDIDFEKEYENSFGSKHPDELTEEDKRRATLNSAPPA